jgi:hypothetical protein
MRVAESMGGRREEDAAPARTGLVALRVSGQPRRLASVWSRRVGQLLIQKIAFSSQGRLTIRGQDPSMIDHDQNQIWSGPGK